MKGIDEFTVVSMLIIGHSYHCAYRQVYGDGECECDLYAKGYDPYAWLKRGAIKEGNIMCEKCWADAYIRAQGNPSKSQTQHYHELLIERKENPCKETPDISEPEQG